MRKILIFLFILSCLGQHQVVNAQQEVWSQDRVQQILSPPTPEEINLVVESWQAPNNTISKTEIVETGKMTYGQQEFNVSVYKYTVGKEDHFTAIYVPSRAQQKSLPILIEIRGVRYDYPPRNISKGPFVMSILGDMAGQFIIVEPCLRGHQLQAIEQMHQADGDRRDSYDGAANDAVLALTMTTTSVPAWDQKHVFSFGVSRGGGVALLHGQRDKRVIGVIAMSAPTDWLQLMKRPGENWEKRIYEAAKHYNGPANDRSAQFYEWFLQGRHELSDLEIRRRLIASSPLYFTEHLPPTLVHQGTADSAIPSVNAAALSDRFLRLGLKDSHYQVVFHEGAGHLLRGSNAAKQSREFLKLFMND